MTTIANIETAAVAPKIYRRSGSWFASFDQVSDQGRKLFCIVDHVKGEVSIVLKDLIEKHCGGVIGGWDTLLGIVPVGSSIPALPISQCEAL